MLISIPNWESSKRSSLHFNDCTSSELLIIISLSTTFELPVNFRSESYSETLVCLFGVKKSDRNVRNIKTWSYCRGRDWIITKELKSLTSIRHSWVLKLLKNYRPTVEITSAPKTNLFISFQLFLFRSPCIVGVKRCC